MKNNRLDELNPLYSQLAIWQQLRDRLAMYMMIYGAFLILSPSLTGHAWHILGAAGFYGSWLILAIMIATGGMWLFLNALQTTLTIRELMQTIKYYETVLPNTQTISYRIGTDGKLIPIDEK